MAIWGTRRRSSPNLFSSHAFNGSVGPSFQWNLLNYGRLANNVWLQDAAFRELVVAYEQTVLLASEEVENGIVTFLRSQQRVQLLDESVTAARAAADTVLKQYSEGLVDFNRVALLQQDLVLGRTCWPKLKVRLRGPDPGLPRSWVVVGRSARSRPNLEQVAEPVLTPAPDEPLPAPPPLPPAPAETLNQGVSTATVTCLAYLTVATVARPRGREESPHLARWVTPGTILDRRRIFLYIQGMRTALILLLVLALPAGGYRLLRDACLDCAVAGVPHSRRAAR